MSQFIILVVIFAILSILFTYKQNKIKKLYETNNYSELEKIFKNALSGSISNTSSIDAYLNLMQLYICAEKFNEAHECINRARELKCNNTILAVNESVLLILEKRFDEAENIINETIENAPEEWKTLLMNNLADVKIGKHQFEEAENILNNLLNKKPRDIYFLTTLADLHFEKQEFDKAKELYQKLLPKSKTPLHIRHIKEKLNNLA